MNYGGGVICTKLRPAEDSQSMTECFIIDNFSTSGAYVPNWNIAIFTTSHSSLIVNGEIPAAIMKTFHRSMWISDDKNNTSSPGRTLVSCN